MTKEEINTAFEDGKRLYHVTVWKGDVTNIVHAKIVRITPVNGEIVGNFVGIKHPRRKSISFYPIDEIRDNFKQIFDEVRKHVDNP